MTLCVAAECKHAGKGYFVFAKDFKVETETSTAEIEAKYTWIGKVEFPALFAGSGSRGIELADLIGQRYDSGEGDGETFVDTARHGAIALKHKVANEYVGALLGITWERVLAEGAAILPPDKHRELVDEVSRLEINCSLLWMAFDETDAHLIRINKTGLVERCSHFAAIGSGTDIAEASLFQREHKNESNLGSAIYHVFGAMKLGSKAPGVGEKFSLHIASMEGASVKWEEITEPYYDHLKKLFARYGPKQISTTPYKSQWVESSDFST